MSAPTSLTGARIVDLDWWESAKLRELTITATPARHASGRTAMFGQDGTLWAGFALLGPKHRAWYSGDTGMFPFLREIGERLGPFDVTMIEVGAYGRWWPDWHLGPEQAVRAHQLVLGRILLPTHWGLFNLSYHGWTEPIERLLDAANQTGTRIALPKPGSSVEPEAATGTVEPWWPEVPSAIGESRSLYSNWTRLISLSSPKYGTIPLRPAKRTRLVAMTSTDPQRFASTSV